MAVPETQPNTGTDGPYTPVIPVTTTVRQWRDAQGLGNIPESTEVDEPLQLEPEPNAQVLEEPSDPEPPPESPKRVPARPVSNAPEEPVLIQFNRHWN